MEENNRWESVRVMQRWALIGSFVPNLPPAPSDLEETQEIKMFAPWPREPMSLGASWPDYDTPGIFFSHENTKSTKDSIRQRIFSQDRANVFFFFLSFFMIPTEREFHLPPVGRLRLSLAKKYSYNTSSRRGEEVQARDTCFFA